MAEDYKVLLGVELNTSDLKEQIAKVDDKHKVKIGVNLGVDDIKKRISKYNENANNAKLHLKIKLDTDDLNKQIRALNLGGAGGGKGVAIPVNTKSLENSLGEVKTIIESIHKSLGTLDDGKGMKSLLTSVNQIADALGKATSESETLVKSLNTLASKDFGINIGLKLGGNSFTNNALYGNEMRDNVIPKLKKQIEALTEEYNRKMKSSFSENEALLSLAMGTKIASPDFLQGFYTQDSKSLIGRMTNDKNLKEQARALKEFIDLFQQAAKLKGLNLDSIVSNFSETPDELIRNAEKIKTGATQTEDSVEKLKDVLNGGGIDAEGLGKVLEPIITDLNEIKGAFQEFSNIKPFEGLTRSLEKLDGTLDKLLSNVNAVKKVVDDGLSITSPTDDSNSGVEKAVQDQKELAQASTETAEAVNQAFNKISVENVAQEFKEVDIAIGTTESRIERLSDALRDVGFNDKTIEDITKDFQNLQISVQNVTSRLNSDGSVVLTVKGIDQYERIVKVMKGVTLDKTTNEWKVNGLGGSVSQNFKEASNFVKQQKNAVADLTNTINQLNRATNDQNASRPIKDNSHLEELKRKYNEVISTIQRMGNASDDNTFQEERNNVKRLITEYKSLTAEYKNAENTATSLRSKDINTAKATYASDLDILIQKMKDADIYTAGFEKGAENLRSSLSSATNKQELILFLNGLDKLEAGYKRAAQSAKSFSQAETYGKRAQGLEQSIKNIQRISPEINEFEVEINGAKVSVQSLLKALSQVKTKGDFNRVNEDLKVFRKAAEAAGISIRETAKESNSNFNKLKSLAKEMGKFEIAKLDASNTIDDINGLQRVLDGFESEYKELYTVAEKSLSPDQIKELDQIFASIAGEVRELRSELNKASESQQLESNFERLKSLIKEIANLKIDVFNFGDIDDIHKAIVQLDKLEKEYDELFAKTKGSLDDKQLTQLSNLENQGNAKVLREFNNELNEFVKLQNQIENTRFEIGKLEIVGDKNNEIETLKRQLEEFEDVYNRLMHTFMKKVSANSDIIHFDDFNGIAEATKNAENRLDRFKSQYADTRAELSKSIKTDIELGSFDNEMDTMYDKYHKLSAANDDLRNSVEALEIAYESMLEASKANTGDEVADRERLIQAEKEYAAALQQTNNLIKIQARADRVEADKLKLKHDIKLFQSDIDNWLKNNSAATKRYGATMQNLKMQAEGVDRVTLNGLIGQFKLADKEAEKFGLKGLNSIDKLKSKFKEYATYLSAAEIFMWAEQGLRDMFEQVKLIDSAMTELKKVTNETDASYNKFLSNAAKKSKELGTTIDGLVSSTADFARLGYGFKDAQGLAEVANIYAVVGDEINGVEGATESLISTMAAFKGEMNGMSNSDFAMSIVDKFNEIGNNFAISSGGIGEALERSASSLMAANNTIDESIALITAANTVVQDPEAVGTAFKTISMRIRGAKTELEEAGLETEGMVDSTAKLRSEILALSGVDIMENANEFKSTYKIMDELAAKWENLTDIQQASLTELIAGRVVCQSVQKCT